MARPSTATYSDPRLAHDRRVFDLYANDLLGVVLLRLGRRQQAALSFWRAAAASPHDMSYRIKAQALGGGVAEP